VTDWNLSMRALIRSLISDALMDIFSSSCEPLAAGLWHPRSSS
jgi:hypothetical protein